VKKEKVILLLIFTLALILRIFQLQTIPAGFHRDEASIGYNAYSILKTGRDEWGKLFPLHFKAFGDYPPGVYFYLTSVSMAIFGVNHFGVRFPAALLGSLTIITIYLLTKTFFAKIRKKQIIALSASFLLAISPWHIIQSRTSSEAIISLFFNSLAIFNFLKFIKKKDNNQKKYFCFYMIFCFLSYYSYHSAKIFLPLINFTMFFFFRDKLKTKNNKKYLKFILFIILLPFFLLTFSNKISERAQHVNIFNSPQIVNQIEVDRLEDALVSKKITLLKGETKLIHNRLIQAIIALANNYLSYFSTNYLFIEGGKPSRYNIPHQGLIYRFLFPLMIIGLFNLIKKDQKKAGFLIVWLLISPLVAAATFEDHPHTRRSLEMIIPIIIISAYGFNQILVNKIIRKIYNFFLISFLGLSFFCIFFFWHQLKVHSLFSTVWSRSYGYKDLVVKVNQLLKKDKYQKAVITSVADEAYIFFLFYNQYPPEKYQQTAQQIVGDQSFINLWGFNDLLFSTDSCPFGKEENTLYIGKGEQCREKIEKDNLPYKILKNPIKRPDGSNVFEVYYYAPTSSKQDTIK